jgi:hypothetical protein
MVSTSHCTECYEFVDRYHSSEELAASILKFYAEDGSSRFL